MEFSWVDRSLLSIGFTHNAAQYIEVTLLVLAFVFSSKLRKNGLGFLVILAPIVLIGDLARLNSNMKWVNLVVQAQFYCLIVSVFNYQPFQQPTLRPLFVLNIIFFLLEAICWYMASKRIFNLFVYNIYYLIRPPIYYVLFYRLLEPKGKYRIGFLTVAVLSMAVFTLEYINNTEVRLNEISIIVLSVQIVIASCLVLFKIVSDDGRQISLLKDPVFWICGGLFLRHISETVLQGLHPFLVTNHIEIYKNPVMSNEPTIRELPFAIMYFCAVCLIVSEFRLRNGIHMAKSKGWLKDKIVTEGKLR